MAIATEASAAPPPPYHHVFKRGHETYVKKTTYNKFSAGNNASENSRRLIWGLTTSSAFQNLSGTKKMSCTSGATGTKYHHGKVGVSVYYNFHSTVSNLKFNKRYSLYGKCTTKRGKLTISTTWRFNFTIFSIVRNASSSSSSAEVSGYESFETFEMTTTEEDEAAVMTSQDYKNLGFTEAELAVIHTSDGTTEIDHENNEPADNPAYVTVTGPLES